MRADNFDGTDELAGDRYLSIRRLASDIRAQMPSDELA